MWRAAGQVGFPYGSAAQLLILTGARREEIGQLKWSEIEDNAIHLDGERTKNGNPHIIPLSSVAQALLAGLPRISEFVFSFGTRAINSWARMKNKIDGLAQIEPWRIHDLRRTVATGLQKQGTILQVTEAVLGHTSGSRAGVVGIYQRHDYADEKRAALEAWGAHVTDLVEGRKPGEVVALRR